MRLDYPTRWLCSAVRSAFGLFCLAWFAGACSAPVARNLDEPSANRVVVALDQAGVTTAKESDSQNEGKWLVTVPRSDISYALSLLSQQGLPQSERPGVAESAAQGSLVPSLQIEQARLLAGTAADLERTLNTIDGVVAARVHLAVPPTDLLVDSPERTAPSASVLIRYRGKALPISPEAVQHLVAGSVASLPPDRVVVLSTQVATLMAPPRKMVPFGPFVVARESLAGLRLLIGGFVVLNLLMLGQLLLFWRRSRLRELGRPPSMHSQSAEHW